MNEILKKLIMLKAFCGCVLEDWAYTEASMFLSDTITQIKKQLQIWESLLQIDGINSKGEVLKDLRKIIEDFEKAEKIK